MKTSNFLLTFGLIGLIAGILCYDVQALDTTPNDGKAIFLAQKCNMCHSVSTAGIVATTQSEKMRGPDLINLKLDAETLGSYLRKTKDINGKKHIKATTASNKDLSALIGWLLEQKK
jgi:cytochrome c2